MTGELKMKNSEKSVIVPETTTTRRIARTANRNGVHSKVEVHNIDIRVDTAAASKRTTVQQKARSNAADKRSRRAPVLAKANRRARHLAKTNAEPCQEALTDVTGMAPITIQQCRRNMVQATGLSGHGMCVTSALEWAFYTQSMKICSSLDRKINIPLQQVKAWMRQYQEANDKHKETIKVQWPKWLMRLHDHKTRWMHTRGPMSVAITTVVDLGWRVRCVTA